MASTGPRVRSYEPADRSRFLSLYETVWGSEKGPAWFRWRFEANPFSDGVPMVVAEADGDLVGAEPLLELPLRAGDRTLAAAQPVDWIVHPDYRRQGLFTRMTERLLADCQDGTDLLFNFPSDALVPGLAKFDWAMVGDVPARYRIQHPGALLSRGDAESTPVRRQLLSGAETVTRRGLALLDRLGSPPDDVTVERHESVPVETIAALYDATPPAELHVPRTEAYLGWRFANPRWETRTYLAVRDGDTVGSVVTATERLGATTRTLLLDSQPMGADDGCTDAFEALLARVVADHRDTDLLRLPGNVCPPLLRRYGFLADSTFPLSRLTKASTHAVRPVSPALRPDSPEDDWAISGLDPTDPDDWCLGLADLDVE
jgi:hypothetical protein